MTSKGQILNKPYQDAIDDQWAAMGNKMDDKMEAWDNKLGEIYDEQVG